MSKRIKKTDNYFERVKQRANRTNYRYYFLITCTSKVSKVIKWGSDVQGDSCYSYIGGL